jgi:hypothetical protein
MFRKNPPPWQDQKAHPYDYLAAKHDHPARNRGLLQKEAARYGNFIGYFDANLQQTLEGVRAGRRIARNCQQQIPGEG